MMTNADPTPAKALILALSRLDQPLSQPLQEAVHQLMMTLRNNSPRINDEIRHLVEQNSHLKKLYEDAYEELETHYQQQERMKNVDIVFPREVDPWDRFIQIVTADDPVLAARQTLQQPNSHTSNSRETVWDKSDRIAVMTAGGAFLGGAIVHLLAGNAFVAVGAIGGALLAALYGWYIGFGKIKSNL
ncbi:hypothetical protein IQ250_25870 [Pseudanabaenaceae cyanobacterium LEGE 13415]|nr:hypothetical protein [Pseudanabaenaceae cyanobacterium LEGE 13415]